jgi:hypothetical protein
MEDISEILESEEYDSLKSIDKFAPIEADEFL